MMKFHHAPAFFLNKISPIALFFLFWAIQQNTELQ